MHRSNHTRQNISTQGYTLLFQPRFQSRRNKLKEYTKRVTILFAYVCEFLVNTQWLLRTSSHTFLQNSPRAKSNPAMEFFCGGSRKSSQLSISLLGITSLSSCSFYIREKPCYMPCPGFKLPVKTVSRTASFIVPPTKLHFVVLIITPPQCATTRDMLRHFSTHFNLGYRQQVNSKYLSQFHIISRRT